MTPLERVILGIGVGAIPGAFAGAFAPAGYFALALAIPLAIMLLGAALAVLRVQPFRWLEEKLRSDPQK
jgi:hypothetical protein